MNMVDEFMNKYSNREILSFLQFRGYFISEDFESKLLDPYYNFTQPS